MIADILTVMWKERKGLLRSQGSRTRAVLGFLIPMVMLGIYLPLQIGRALVEGPWSLLASVFIPMMLVGMMIPESFAGERERHTLETLLASRLTDRAILFGKVAVAVGYAWGITLMLLLVSLVMPMGWSVIVLHPYHGSGQRSFEPAHGKSRGGPRCPDFTARCDSTRGSADPDDCYPVSPRPSAVNTALTS